MQVTMLRVLITIIWWLCSPVLAAPAVVRYPQPQNAQDHRSDYAIALLAAALSRSSPQTQVQPSRHIFSRSRALEELAPGGGVDVVWTLTSVDREQKYLPVRIPIYFGYGGYRVLLIHQQQASRFAALRTGAQWRELRFAQVHDWLDTGLLRQHGWQVQGVSQYANLFPLLLKNRVDAVPRGVLEVSDEAAQWQADGLIIESQWLLKYPSAEYFFVSQQNPQLALLLQQGLQQMQQDGSLQRLFDQHFAAKLKALDLPKRRVIAIQNPYLPVRPHNL
ncbi:transporter substrate-binding domain-containing protein [Rheinheimera texasensis]|uniref:transporter substrate-binding domain-containing protein n=1 Tax=Rheinheimera texasensis TaxID=306205 RepID=UPI0004E12639|nr:transporter substrate-binding domain-containing protein [Rheinheimera texasensis]